MTDKSPASAVHGSKLACTRLTFSVVGKRLTEVANPPQQCLSGLCIAGIAWKPFTNWCRCDPVLKVSDEQKPQRRNGQLIRPIVRAVRCVKRYGHQAKTECSLIETDQLHAVFQQNRNPVARHQTGGNKTAAPPGNTLRHIQPKASGFSSDYKLRCGRFVACGHSGISVILLPPVHTFPPDEVLMQIDVRQAGRSCRAYCFPKMSADPIPESDQSAWELTGAICV